MAAEMRSLEPLAIGEVARRAGLRPSTLRYYGKREALARHIEAALRDAAAARLLSSCECVSLAECPRRCRPRAGVGDA